MSSPTLGPKPLNARHFYQFGPFKLEPEERILLRDDDPVELEGGGKAFDLLVLLVKYHGRLVRRDQIVSQVWDDAHVEGNVIDVQIRHLRKALGDGYITTVTKHGFRFSEEVTEGQAEPETASRSPIRKGSLLLFFLIATLALTAAFTYSFWKKTHRTGPIAILYQRALEYERLGDDEEARTILDQALALDPHDSEACVRAAYLSYELEETTKVGKYLEQCQKDIGSANENLRLKANALYEVFRDDETRAMELYQLLVDRYPRDADAWFRFAEVATDSDRLQDGEKAVTACISLEFDNPYCRFQSMYLKIKQNKFNEVIADYKSLPTSVRNYPWFDEPVGIAFWGNGQMDEAAQAFERLTQHQQRLHGTALFTAGREWLTDMMLYEGRIDEATRRLEQIMETSDNAPARGSYLAYLGKINALLGDDVHASEFAAQVGSSPAEPSSLTDAALVMARIGDDRAGQKLLAVRNEMTNEELSPANEHFFRGALALARKDFTGAIEEIQLAYDLNPHNEEAAYWLGMAHYEAGDYPSAIKAFNGVASLKGAVLLDDVPLLVPLTARRIAECYQHLGNTKAAEPYNQQVEKIWEHADNLVRKKFLN